jgi:predicted peptidase
MKKIFLSFVALFVTASVSASHIKQTTAINEVFGDGSKVSAVAIEYDGNINPASVNMTTYKVNGHKIIGIGVSNSADKYAITGKGRFVIIKLEAKTVLKAVSPNETKGMIQGPVAGGRGMMNNNHKEEETHESVIVSQVKNIKSIDGNVYKPEANITCKKETCLIADDFVQLTFKDDSTGINLKYNLYIPKNYNPQKTYPMLLFIHDASGAGRSFTNTLTQGDGVTVWASPEEQAKHPCFVLAPQFDRVTVDDNYTALPDLDALLHLVDTLMHKYAIDPDRVYTTGQSMGCMSSYVLMLKRPNLFAAAMLVAGQWNPDVMAPLATKNLWLISCTGDLKSSQGAAAAIKVWKQNGAKVSEATWPLTADKATRAQEVSDMIAKGCNIKFTHLEGGSHNNTWRIAYDIEGIRDWLFSRSRQNQ